jgi:hypothetical protein
MLAQMESKVSENVVDPATVFWVAAFAVLLLGVLLLTGVLLTGGSFRVRIALVCQSFPACKV